MHVVDANTGSRGRKFGTENNRRNIVLALNIDGVTPFKQRQKSYTPVQVQILNLPERFRHRPPFILLPMLIPGPKAPQSMKAYLTVLLSHLQRLESEGFDAVDPTLNPPAVVRVYVKLLCSCCDLPAHADNNMQQGAAAYYGCMKCEIKVSRHRAGLARTSRG
jgi:hypothetical protein